MMSSVSEFDSTFHFLLSAFQESEKIFDYLCNRVVFFLPTFS